MFVINRFKNESEDTDLKCVEAQKNQAYLLTISLFKN
jgi:hypothetical protein